MVFSFQRHNISHLDSLLPTKASTFVQSSHNRKQLVFDICQGTPLGPSLQMQPIQIQNGLIRNKQDSTIDRSPFKPEKIWRKIVQGKVDQGKVDQGLQHLAHGPQLLDNTQEECQINVNQNLDQDALTSSKQQLRVTFPYQMLENLVSTLQQKALIGKFSSASLSFLDIKNWVFSLQSRLRDIF